PEPQRLELRTDRERGVRFLPADVAGERVLGLACAARGERAAVAPQPGPRRVRIALAAAPELAERAFLVTDERAIRRGGPGDAVLESRLPVDLVAVEHREVDAGVARRLDIGARGRRPVLVVSHRKEHL